MNNINNTSFHQNQFFNYNMNNIYNNSLHKTNIYQNNYTLQLFRNNINNNIQTKSYFYK